MKVLNVVNPPHNPTVSNKRLPSPRLKRSERERKIPINTQPAILTSIVARGKDDENDSFTIFDTR